MRRRRRAIDDSRLRESRGSRRRRGTEDDDDNLPNEETDIVAIPEMTAMSGAFPIEETGGAVRRGTNAMSAELPIEGDREVRNVVALLPLNGGEGAIRQPVRVITPNTCRRQRMMAARVDRLIVDGRRAPNSSLLHPTLVHPNVGDDTTPLPLVPSIKSAPLHRPLDRPALRHRHRRRSDRRVCRTATTSESDLGSPGMGW